MKTPDHRAGPAFEKAADALEAWRQQQMAALTETQRQLFEEARRRAKEREEANAKELQARKLADMQERMREKLLAPPRLELVMAGRRVTMTEALARRLTAEYFQPGRPQRLWQFDMMVHQAAQAVIREIEHEHGLELQAHQERERQRLDKLLRRFERGRQTQPEKREEFARAAAEGKARTDFGKAARGDGTSVDPLKSEAIARAIERVRKKEEEERARADRDRQSGRSLTDTFSRTR